MILWRKNRAFSWLWHVDQADTWDWQLNRRFCLHKNGVAKNCSSLMPDLSMLDRRGMETFINPVTKENHFDALRAYERIQNNPKYDFMRGDIERAADGLITWYGYKCAKPVRHGPLPF